MTEKYKEKIGFFACVDNNDNPVGAVEFEQFPANYSFTFKTLFFNFNVDYPYQVITQISNSKEILLLNSQNTFSINSNELTDEKYTNDEKTQASSLIQVKTPAISVIEHDIFKATLTVFDNEKKLEEVNSYFVVKSGTEHE
ncbi:hypothetical protein [Paucilactobacillus kaifaensis]|uniref:hypothetical protein n=1 Tax=Paucilactobacillus kaifaensis TaxID=2559921 RepID=UPI0010F88AD0|nr:hypothetical protein [Paucilactobacillus kaifaensis]